MSVGQVRTTNAAEVLKDTCLLESAESEERKSFRRYAEYRDSGVEWVEEVPMGWEVKPLKITATINDDTLLENTDPDFEFDYVDIGSVDYVEGISSKETMTFENAPSRARRRVKSGDSIVSTVRTYLRAIASIGEFDKPLIVSTGFAVVRPKSVYSDFLAYALKASFFVQSVVARSVGVSYPAVNTSEVGNISVPVPSEKEQTAIAAFLDRETAKIDGLIEKQEHLIELLREKRQAVISHIVTKGLNPNAKLKDSGVEWLGEVPEGWAIKSLKYAFRRIVGGSTPSSAKPIFWDGDIVWITPADVSKAARLRDSRRRITREGLLSCSTELVPSGSIIVTSRAPVGNVALAETELCTNQGCKALIVPSSTLSPIFAFHLLSILKSELQRLATGTTFTEIATSKLGAVQLPIPPLREQIAIIAYFNRETAKIDSLIERCETAIKLFKERRIALISAAVTGKIDVRSAV